MNPQNLAVQFLRVVGVVLVLLALVHLLATPHIPGLLRGCPVAVRERAEGATLLNHVLVGILLFPLGYTTWLAAASWGGEARWGRGILVVNTGVMVTLPISLVVFMRRPEYYTAPLFLTGVALVAVISLLMGAATCVLLCRQKAGPTENSSPGR